MLHAPSIGAPSTPPEAANPFARMALCGMISQYNDTEAGVGIRNMIQCVGKITWKQTVREGIENAPAAFLGLFAGENFGKMLVKLG